MAATMTHWVDPVALCSSISCLALKRTPSFLFLPGSFHRLLLPIHTLGKIWCFSWLQKKAWDLSLTYQCIHSWGHLMVQDGKVIPPRTKRYNGIFVEHPGEEVSILPPGPELLAAVLMPCMIEPWRVDPRIGVCSISWIPATILKLKQVCSSAFQSWHLSSSHYNKEQSCLIGRAVRWCLGLKAVWSSCLPIHQLSLSPSPHLSDSFLSHQWSFTFHLRA